MNAPRLIGLTGPAGCGKDTVRAILEEHGYNGLAFADPIRHMLRELFTSNGICTSFMDARNLKEAPIPQLCTRYRHLAQTLGTEWGRSVAPDLWLRLAASYMGDLSNSGELATDDGYARFVISDVRFANEADWVRQRGGVIWRINRPQAAPVRAHVSETEMQSIQPDVCVDNTDTLDHLRTQVQQALALQFGGQSEVAA